MRSALLISGFLFLSECPDALGSKSQPSFWTRGRRSRKTLDHLPGEVKVPVSAQGMLLGHQDQSVFDWAMHSDQLPN